MSEKTNVMRVLDKKKIKYGIYDYADTGAVSGTDVAETLGQNPEQVFKTLVTIGKTKEHYVFVIPVNRELDLKKAARVVGEKSIEMIKSNDLLALTGYIHGGCSPIGMKKFFKTTIDKSAKNFSTFCFSAGKIGYQVEITLDDLSKVIRYQLADITTLN
ncbi:Cys-tRNA(Pro) deacylase [Alkaliphilus sp. B6464]|uniref:Cys-tRNA(Pro) deacylase n=1 Tax=Alkaliphilus sp. B6464 TaxID=2731219 RepID=UPI001BA60E25|nr:Cys-tRNA(Pro) deacylase [Alkaliphilus sp. B6464]QUH20131.1 Cys-tRNA(Pro) deacylase [Alkaliphilus sp. B6464]